MSNTASMSIRYKIYTTLWFGLAVVMSILWLFLWIGSDSPKKNEEHQKSEISVQDLRLPTYIEHYVQLTKEVPPIDFSTVIRDLRNYPEEFKDKKYFEKNAKYWTVQVMNVAQNEIITTYLDGRADRDKFAYFRYHTTNNELRYVLTYGTMGSTQEALGAIGTVDFGLPKTVKLKPEEMKRYLNIIDNYERAAMADSSNDARQIILNPTSNVLPAQPLRTSASKLGGTDNKFQNALPNTGVPDATRATLPNTTSTAGANLPAATTNTPKSTSTPATPKAQRDRPAPQEQEPNQEFVVDMSIAPKPTPAPPPVQEAQPSVTYTQSDVVYGEASKPAARPNTNTANIPGADRD